MPIDAKKVREELETEAKEAKLRKKMANSGGIGMLWLKPGQREFVQFLCDFEGGMELNWHDHKDNFKLSGPCYKAYGLPCPHCKHLGDYKKMKAQYFFPVYVFAKANQEDEKFPLVGVKVLNIKRASNHPWETVFDMYTDGEDLRETRFMFKRNTAEGSETVYSLTPKGSAHELPDDVKLPTEEEMLMAIARANDKALFALLNEDEDDDEDEMETPAKKAPAKLPTKVMVDTDEEKQMFQALKKKRQAVQDDEDEEKPVKKAKKQQIVDEDDEEVVVKKIAKVSTLPTPKKEEEEDEDDDVSQFRFSVS